MCPYCHLTIPIISTAENNSGFSVNGRNCQGLRAPSLEEPDGGDVIWGCFPVVQTAFSSPSTLTLSKLRVHDCRGGALEKGVILAGKAMQLVSGGEERARSGGTFPWLPALRTNYGGKWTCRGTVSTTQGQALTLFHWDLSFSFSNRLYSRRSLRWVRAFQMASRRMPMSTTPDTVPPTMRATWGPPTHSEARRKHTDVSVRPSPAHPAPCVPCPGHCRC